MTTLGHHYVGVLSNQLLELPRGRMGCGAEGPLTATNCPVSGPCSIRHPLLTPPGSAPVSASARYRRSRGMSR
jgi:hypothetical protein